MEQVLPTVFRHIVSAETIFLGLEIQRSQYIRPKVTVYKCAETIQGRKLYEEIRYMYFKQNIGGGSLPLQSCSVSKETFDLTVTRGSTKYNIAIFEPKRPSGNC